MKWLSSWVPLLALSLLLALAVSAIAASTSMRKLKHASGPITAMAMDGSRLAYSTDAGDVYVWNLRSGAISHMHVSSGSDFPPIHDVAIAGQRVAWIESDVSGNSMFTNENLVTASLGKHGTRWVAHAYRDFDLDLSQWQLLHASSPPEPTSPPIQSRTTTPTHEGTSETISNARLSAIGAKNGLLRRIASGEQAIVSRGTEAGRIAVLRPGGTSVGIYSATGALLRQITPSAAQEIALGGGRLVVLTETKTLKVYNPLTGLLEHTWSVKPKATYTQLGHLQAYGRIAVFAVGAGYSSHGLRIIDLKTGKSLFLPWRLARPGMTPLSDR
jgi:hypothetical protein